MSNFEELGVRARTSQILERQKITEPQPVQRDAIPKLIDHKDVVIQAPTGSGKTLAYVLPMVEKLAGPNGGLRALVLTPTRELATQIATVINTVDPALRVVIVVGGVGYGRQISGIRGRADVVVGCPGRVLDLCEQNILRLNTISYLVLDEADEMLDQGFARDVERIITQCPTAQSPAKRQTVLASATMPDWVRRLIEQHTHEPVYVRITEESVPSIEHGILPIGGEKIDTLTTLLTQQRANANSQTIVFHRTKHGARKLAKVLNGRGHSSVELQGNLSQNARDRAIKDFKAGRADVMVATNVAARGIDVVNVGLVINYELPDTPQWLTHRIGRTARNGNAGRAITFIGEGDKQQWRKLRKQGAPNLPHIDQQLLVDGTWSLSAAREDLSNQGDNRPAPRGPQYGNRSFARRDGRRSPAPRGRFSRAGR